MGRDLPPTPRIITRLEFARRRLQISQYDLGHDPKVRIHQSFISLCELGKGIPTPEQAERLARRLGLDPNDLLKPVEMVTEPIEARA